MPLGSLDRRRKSVGDYVFPISVGLFLLGFELATRAITVGLVRLREGARDLLASEPVLHVPDAQFALGIALLVGGAFSGVIGGWRLLAFRSIGGTSCPTCGQETKRIRRKAHHRIAGFFLGSNISRRRCAQCGWVGLAKDI